MDWENLLRLQEVGAGWAAALGTVAAACAAVWLGLRERMWRMQKNEIDEAIFTSLFRPEAEALIKQLQGVRSLHQVAVMGGLRSVTSILALEDARTYGKRPALVETRRYVAQFGALGEYRATALARVVGSLGLLEEALVMASHYEGEGDMGLAQNGLQETQRLVDRIQASLRIALQINDEEYQEIIRPPIQGVVKRSERRIALEKTLVDLLAAGKIAP